MGILQIGGEYIEFLKQRRKWWLWPIVIVMLLLGALVVITQGSAIAPFIYTLF
jgi:NAD/NADP transhydrogenase beta subunit